MEFQMKKNGEILCERCTLEHVRVLLLALFDVVFGTSSLKPFLERALFVPCCWRYLPSPTMCVLGDKLVQSGMFTSGK